MSNAEIPTKPYLLRALYEWCVDNGYTPHLAVKVDSQAQVPLEYVKNGEITLNVSPTAVHKLQMGNDLIEFSARFGGVARQISVQVANVFALYAKETGQGMTFEIDVAKPAVQAAAEGEPTNASSSNTPSSNAAVLVPSKDATPAALPAPPKEPTKPGGGKPQLRRIK
jgi:stringent starvation protein B